ncbi:reverse transcriptase [Gossypium australe]|uniref:Reverse transcriptase n=1 Tax=Gossypium australe TaxID=47621 RepID=A0A5B6X4I4_9ROSI|nr:reverse transcriptase [Gossypium australe]
MNEKLLQTCFEGVVWRVVKDMGPLKAPEIDGFLALFFQRYLHKRDWRLLLIALRCCDAILWSRILMQHYCIHETQWAFIPGRQILDNVLVAYDFFHTLKNEKWEKKSNFALKLNISKTYDRVEWDFLAMMMLRLGFHED